ncbi:putative ABC transporter membrane protein, partial [Pseudomonas savastanoi pv. glycinea str. race 4]
RIGATDKVIQFMGGRPVKLLYTPFAVVIALVHVI